MPRSSRYGSARGTHMGRGVASGTTVGTIPSGVTMTRQGLESTAGTVLTPTELAYLNSIATRAVGFGKTIASFVETGVSQSHTSTVNITFSRISNAEIFIPSIFIGSSASGSAVYGRTATAPMYCTWAWGRTPAAGRALSSVSVFTYAATGPLHACNDGVSVAYIAIGT